MRGIGSQACQQTPAVLVVGPKRYRALQVGDRGGALAVLPEGEPEVAMNVGVLGDLLLGLLEQADGLGQVAVPRLGDPRIAEGEAETRPQSRIVGLLGPRPAKQRQGLRGSAGPRVQRAEVGDGRDPVGELYRLAELRLRGAVLAPLGEDDAERVVRTVVRGSLRERQMGQTLRLGELRRLRRRPADDQGGQIVGTDGTAGIRLEAPAPERVRVSPDAQLLPALHRERADRESGDPETRREHRSAYSPGPGGRQDPGDRPTRHEREAEARKVAVAVVRELEAGM